MRYRFKTLVIRMLTELIEFGCRMNQEMKAIQSEIKETIQGTKSPLEGKRRNQNSKSTIWNKRKK